MRFLPALLFFFSGCASLIFEVLCSRKLALVTGSTVFSASTTVSAFLLGLGLGAWIAGRHVGRVRRPLLTFALLEAYAGLAVMAVLWVIPHLPLLMAPLARMGSGPLALGRIVASFVLLLIPTLAMGASLPILSHYYISNKGHSFIKGLGRLYAINTLGAVAGVVAADFALVENLGVWGTGWVSAALYWLVALLVLPQAMSATVEPASLEKSGEAKIPWLPLVVLVASGFCGLMYQVIWTRLLTFHNGADVFAFSTTLATYLLGLVIGSVLVSQMADESQDAIRLAWALLFLAAVGYSGVFSGEWVGSLREALAQGIKADRWLSLVTSFALVVPGATILGVIFPLASRYLKRSQKAVGATVGGAYLANTLGSVAGALSAGFLMLPFLGLQGSLAVASLLTLSVGCWALFQQGRSRLSSALIVLALMAAGLTPSGLMARALFEDENTKILYQADDHYGSIAVVRQWDTSLKQNVENLIVDGFNMAGNSVTAKRYTVGLGGIPLLLHPEPEDALVVCLGLANTLRTVLDYSETKRVDCVELSSQVVQGLSTLEQGRYVLNHPKLNLILGDGRNHLLYTDRRYDVISAEPPPPSHAGVVNLYSKEYYELCRSRLKEGGIVVQWLPVFQLSQREAKTIIVAFQEVFPYSYLWESTEVQLILVGRLTPMEDDFEALQQRVEQNSEVLEASGWDDPLMVAATLLATPEQLREYTKGVPPLSDNWPWLQYSKRDWFPDFDFFYFAKRPQAELFKGLSQAQEQRLKEMRRALAAFHLYFLGPRMDASLGILERHDLAGLIFETFRESSYFEARTLSSPDFYRWYEEAPESGEKYYHMARVHLLHNRYQEALKAIEQALAVEAQSGLYKLYRGLCLFRLGRSEETKAILEELRQQPIPELEKERVYLEKLYLRAQEKTG